MRRPLYFIVLILLAITVEIAAQETDTVYIQQAPLIIKKQVVVEMPEINVDTSKAHHWLFSISTDLGKYTSKQEQDSIEKKLSTFFCPNISIGRKQNNWLFSIGIGKSFSKLEAQYYQEIAKTVETQPQSFDTTGSYIKNGITYYYIDTIPARNEIRKHDSTLYIRNNISYWRIPLQIGYQFNYKRFYMLPQLGIVYNFSTQANLFRNTEISLPKNYWGISYGLHLGFQLSKKIALELGINQQKQVSNMNPYLKLSQMAGSISLKISL